LTHGFNLPARLALKEVANAVDSTWNTAFEDTELDGFTLDFWTLRMIHKMRKSRIDAYKNFIQRLQSCSFNTNCTNSLENWKSDLLKKFEEGPNSTTFSVVFHKGWTCASCRQNMMTRNSDAFTTFITLQATEESKLPELR